MSTPRRFWRFSGPFEPVQTEIEAEDLSLKGELPQDLLGTYLRNRPDPRFTPLGSSTYPLEGDGIVHGLWLEECRARYANRWVRTRGMAAEEGAGRTLYGGVLTAAIVEMDLLGPDPDPGWPSRLDPFINVVCHAGRFPALEEGTPPYEITPDLATVGLYDFGGALAGMCAHPKIDPVTGEMVLFRDDVEEPYLTWTVVGPDGAITLGPSPVPEVERGFMIQVVARRGRTDLGWPLRLTIRSRSCFHQCVRGRIA